MLLPVLLCTVFGFQQPTAIPVLHSRPSRMLERMGRLAPADLRVEANDQAGTLVCYGTSAEVDQMREYVQLFDVIPANVRLRIETSSPMDKFEGKTVTQVANNAPWSMEDPNLGISLRVMPRLNDDGTTTLFVTSKSKGHTYSAVVRVRSGEGAWVRPGYALFVAPEYRRGTVYNGTTPPSIVKDAPKYPFADADLNKILLRADREGIPILRLDAARIDQGKTWSEAPGFATQP